MVKVLNIQRDKSPDVGTLNVAGGELAQSWLVTADAAPAVFEIAAAEIMVQLMKSHRLAVLPVPQRPGRALATSASAQHVAPILRNGTRLDLYRVALQYTVLPDLFWGVVDVHTSSVRGEEERFSDLDGKPYLNTAGDLYNPPPKLAKYNLSVTLTARHEVWHPGQAAAFLGYCNSSYWLGFHPRTVLFRDARGRRVPYLPNLPTWALGDRRYFYWEVAYEFEIESEIERGWHPTRVLARGPAAKAKASDAKSTLACDNNNVGLGKPVLLAADGTKLPVSGKNVTPHYQEFRQHREFDFQRIFPWLKESPFG